MAKYLTPGIYTEEINAFPNSIVEFPTAIPAFIGYTEKAIRSGINLVMKPIKIESIRDYFDFFGEGPKYQFGFSQISPEEDNEFPEYIVGGKRYVIKQVGQKFNLYRSLLLYFQNGGGSCYILSVGNYEEEISLNALESGLNALSTEKEPTIIVVPEAIYLKSEECFSLQKSILKQCSDLKSRFAIMDIYDGYQKRNYPKGDVINNFRTAIGDDHLSYGAAYYPWLHTTIVPNADVNLSNLDVESLSILKDLIQTEHHFSDPLRKNQSSKPLHISFILDNLSRINDGDYQGPSIKDLTEDLSSLSLVFKNILAEIAGKLNLLPPSGAVAGVFVSVDLSRGVWKAPANVSLNSVSKAAVAITQNDQEDLNIPLGGKSINAIREFAGKGVLVWGARTLQFAEPEWRYINVKRSVIMLEQSISTALKSYIFEPNDANTWIIIRSTVENFLFNQWKLGMLAGSVPREAFDVKVGLGITMTAQDILESRMNVMVLVALSRPAEFIIMTFQQQMQKS